MNRKPAASMAFQVRRGQHAGIGDDDHVGDTMACLERLDDRDDRLGLGLVSLEAGDLEREAGAVHEQADHDLRVDAAFLAESDLAQTVFGVGLEVQRLCRCLVYADVRGGCAGGSLIRLFEGRHFGSLVSEDVGLLEVMVMLKVMPDVVGGPLSLLIGCGLRVWLGTEGYARSTARQVLAVARGLSQWMEDHGVGIDDVDVGVLDSFEAAHGPGVAGRAIVEQRLPTVRRFLMDQGLVPDAVRPLKRPRPPDGAPPVRVDSVVEAELSQWACWQREMRGISEDCIRTRRRWVVPLVDSMPQVAGRLGWDECDVEALNAFVGERCRGWSQASGVLILDATRSLWGWALATGRVQRDLRGGILRARGTRATLPKGLPPKDITSMLDACDLSTPAGLRDRGVILVLSRLGLRAGEAADLGLDDIDWNRGHLSVIGKGRRLELPLPIDVGQALVDWLEVRPKSADRRVFTRVRGPAGGLSSAGVSGIVTRRARDAGLGVIHAHRLRHSAATNILGAGGSLVEAQELLGHHSAGSTLVYARTDLSSLRALSVSWGRWPR